ncbi:MAG: heavy metal translocating P-type ATPase metal-binding domain-containing protein [Haliscomenobacter sp.]|nr:heavy metal translocating P-type ATPase metal-binding domain-containing protein [Haliscomenobacter sp.]
MTAANPTGSGEKRLRIADQTACYHCGEPCPASPVVYDEKHFCCEGCRTVFDILNNNGLCQYYQIDENAGVSLRGKSKEEYAYLDEPDVRSRLVDFTDGERTRVRFFLPQIHCASCIWLLENLYKLNDGIVASQVNFLKKEIYLTFLEEKTTLRKVVELLSSIGYAPAINLGSLDKEKRPVTDRSFTYKLGVAGFAFGNIMLLSFPEYLGLEKDQDSYFFQFFGYLNIFLSIPVVFYSGSDYFRSAWLGLKNKELTIDVPLALGILVYFIRSAYEILSHSEAGYMDSLAGLVFFLLVGKWFQQRTYHHISFERDYRSYFPVAARRKQDGQERPVSLDLLEPGDVIVVRHGELIPADAVILRGEARIDYSFVTGEAQPVLLPAGEKVFAGGRQQGATLELSLTKRVAQSYLTQLWNEEAFAKKQEMQASRLANQIGKYFTITILLIGVAALVYWLPRDATRAINAFTAVLIVACPCAVALAIPFIFGNVLRILGRHQFYLKNTNVVEAMRSVTKLVVDKTGTITTRMKGDLDFMGEPPLTLEEQAGLQTIASQSVHPLSQLIRLHFEHQGIPPLENTRLSGWEEFTGRGIAGVVDGIPYRLGSPEFIGVTADEGEAQDSGIWVEINGIVRGYFAVTQYLRPGTEALIHALREMGEVALLSGDNEREREQLTPLFEGAGQMHFRMSPKEKLQFVKRLQEEGAQVMMIGDGLNDAGALKQSNLGIVITEDTNNFTPASDAILHASSYTRLPQLLRFARKSVHLVYGAYGFALAYNLIGLSFAVQGALSPLVAAILMPLSSVTIVLFGLVGSNLLARRFHL